MHIFEWALSNGVFIAQSALETPALEIFIGDCVLVTSHCVMEAGVQRTVAVSTPESKAAALQGRLSSFGAAIIAVTFGLPKTQQARHVAGQMLRSGTAAAANYAEARSAESLSDFIHKLRIVLKELNETEVWLQLAIKSSWVLPEKINPIVAENRELCRIIAKSIQTAGGFRR